MTSKFIFVLELRLFCPLIFCLNLFKDKKHVIKGQYETGCCYYVIFDIPNRKEELTMLDTLKDFVFHIASMGAGLASLFMSYQPKTPDCLMDDETK